jgi:GMP synthase-like glutamine amidotransferase
MHRDHVPSVPPEFHLLGSTPVSFNQGMARFHNTAMSSTSFSLTDIHILTVQGHPEFTKSISSAIIEARSASGILSTETVEDARRRADRGDDGVALVGRVIWGVLDVRRL